VLATLDFPRLRARAAAGTLPPLLRNLVRAPNRTPDTAPDRDAPTLRDRLSGLPEADQHRLLLDMVRGHVATVLGHSSPESVETERGFLDMGFDSLTAVELRNRLSTASGLRLPATLAFDYPTSTALARYLRTQIGPAGSGPTSTPTLADLDRLAGDLWSIPPDGRRALAIRLQDLLVKLAGVEEAGGEPPIGVTDQLASASDDEVFAFIDKELGVS
jgi:acyl carrier protein